MISLKDSMFTSGLPAAMGEDVRVNALAYAVHGQVEKLLMYSDLAKVYAGVNKCTGAVLDMLANELHIPSYKDSLGIEIKRKLVLNGLLYWLNAGTAGAVEELCSTIFEKSTISEWYEYGGQPGYFKLVTEEVTTDEAVLGAMRKTIEASKNVRSVFDGFEFILHLMDELRAKERTLTSLSNITPERYPWRGRCFDGGWCFSEVNAHGGTWQHDGHREYSGALDGEEDIPEMARAFDGEFGFNGRNDFWLRHATRKALFDSEEADTLALCPKVNAIEHYRSIGDFAGRDFSGGWHFGSDSVTEKGLTLIITRKTDFSGAWRFNGKKILGRYDWHEFGNAWRFDGTSSFGQKTYSA